MDNIVAATNWLPTNGYNPLSDGSQKMKYYSVNPNLKVSQGVPEGFSEYGTVIAFPSCNYSVMFYIDVYRNFAIYHNGAWKSYSPLLVYGVEGHNYKLGYDGGLYVIIDSTRFDIQTK